VPAFVAEGVHPFDRTLDELARLIDFFYEFTPVGVRDDETVAAGRAITFDLVPKLLAVSVIEPNHWKSAYISWKGPASLAVARRITNVSPRARQPPEALALG